MTFLQLLPFVFLLSAVVQAPDARAVVHRATRAVRTDSVAILNREWQSRLDDQPDDATALLGLATLARWQYDYERADSLYHRLLGRGAGSTPTTAAAAIGYGDGIRWRGRFTEAEPWYARAVDAAHAVNDPALEAWALILLATVQARTRGLAPAQASFRAGMAVLPPEDSELLALKYCLGAGLGISLNVGSTRDQAAAGIEFARRATDPTLEATCLQIVVQDYLNRGNVDSAIAVLSRQSALQEAAGDRVGLAATHQWAGYLFRVVGALGRARELLFAAVEEGNASGNQSPVAWAYMNLGFVARAVGDFTAAAEYAARAETMFQEQGDRVGATGAIELRGDIARFVGDYELSRRKYAEAMQWREQSGSRSSMFAIHSILAEIAISEGNLAAGERELDTALQMARAGGMTGWEQGLTLDRARLAFRRDDLVEVERILGAYVEGFAGSPLRWYRALELRAAARALRGDLQGADDDLTRGLDGLSWWRGRPSIRTIRQYAFQAVEQLDHGDPGVATVLAAFVRGDRVDRALVIAERQRAQLLLERMVRAEALRARDDEAGPPPPPEITEATLDSIVAAIPDDETAIIEYVTGAEGEPTVAFHLTRAGVGAVVLDPVSSWRGDIARFTSLLASGEDVGATPQRIGDALLSPVTRALPADIRRLVVVPDGPLHRIAFDALRIHDGSLVVERYAVSQMPSAAVAAQLWNRSDERTETPVLALGDVTFPKDSGSGTAAVLFRAFQADGGLPSLSASRGEARRAARYAPGSEARLARDASEAFLKTADLTGYGVIHFATHARVDDAAETHTALALAPGDGEDGFVTPGDLAALTLDARLVILSGCRTAAGVVIRGEGLQGLSVPLLVAGARAVLATAWSVKDQAAADFMSDFYRLAARGLPVGDALRETKRSARDAGAPATTWAAFTIVGDPNVRLGLTEPPAVHWWWLAALVAAIGAACLWFGKKRRPVARAPVVT